MIHITIEPEKREGIFGAANALAALEAPVKALQESAEALGATVTVSHEATAPTIPTRRKKRTSAQVAADKAGAAKALADALVTAKNGAAHA
jgi:CHASE3 domain sensor protein